MDWRQAVCVSTQHEKAAAEKRTGVWQRGGSVSEKQKIVLLTGESQISFLPHVVSIESITSKKAFLHS
jgi:hypothetical protein